MRIQFCTVCLEDVKRAIENCAVELPQPDLAVAEQLVHDGTRMTVEHLCEHHVGVTLDCAIQHWGFTLKDKAIAYPKHVN